MDLVRTTDPTRYLSRRPGFLFSKSSENQATSIITRVSEKFKKSQTLRGRGGNVTKQGVVDLAGERAKWWYGGSGFGFGFWLRVRAIG
jgi:hypothetical protein